ncbi:MAG: hypothetical protein HY926_13230 [Elusimicrobia bacterium]|nr:hypothetical protein [Elusimicrobiota bacterium]
MAEIPVPAVAAQAVLPLRGLLSVWSQDCSPACGLPSALVKNDPADLDLPLPEKPGEFRSVRLRREVLVAGKTLQVQADFYALCPARPGAPSPQGSRSPLPQGTPDCPGRYFSVQVELSGAAAALCTASLNTADFSPFPVIACGAPGSTVPGGQTSSSPERDGAPAGGKRLGVTLHRTPLP